MHTRSSFVTLGEPIDSYNQARRAGTKVGVLLGSARSRFLRRQGLTNVLDVGSEEQIATMLDAGRVDAWYTMDWRAAHIFRAQRLDPGRLVIGKPVWPSPQFLAAHKDFDPGLAGRIAEAVNTLRASAEHDAIIDRYIP